MLDLQVETIFFPRSFISNSFLKNVICCSYVLFRSPNKIWVINIKLTFENWKVKKWKIANYAEEKTREKRQKAKDFLFLNKNSWTYGVIHILSFSRYSLRRLYHINPNCFNPYKDCSKLIEYMLRDFVLFALGNLNHLGIFMYISLSMDPYKYVVITCMRHIFSLLRLLS